MARQVEEEAKGAANPTAGPVKTPAPDEISHVRSPSGQSYGENGPDNNSPSVPPGKRVVSALGLNLESSVNDPALQTVIAQGHRIGDKNFQTRVIDSEQKVPTAHGMKSRDANSGSPGDTIPAKLGASSAQPVRKPGA